MRTAAPRWIALALLVASGCFSAGPVPQDRFYRLAVGEGEGEPLPAPRFEGALAVDRFSADGLTGQRPILFRKADQPLEVRQHHYHYWVESPTEMLQEQLADFLRGRAVAGAVLMPELRARADYQVSGRIRRFERVLGSRPRVVVELRLTLQEARTGEVLWSDTYRVENGADSDEVIDSVAAFDRSLTDLFRHFLDDISSD